jgi:hypothetical protein
MQIIREYENKGFLKIGGTATGIENSGIEKNTGAYQNCQFFYIDF